MLVAIADLAVQRGSDDCRELDLPVRSIAEQFIELYWRQCAPYGNGVADGGYNTLMQNTGQQASVISIVRSPREKYGTLTLAKRSSVWARAVSETTQLIRTMPLWRLQVLRNETLDFLYTESPVTGNIRLKRDAAANLRKFHGMIIQLAQSEWLRFIQRLPGNAPLLGATSDLGQFLFGAERSALIRMAEPLAAVQSGLSLTVSAQSV